MTYYFIDRRVLITAVALMEDRGYNSFRNPPDLRARVTVRADWRREGGGGLKEYKQSIMRRRSRGLRDLRASEMEKTSGADTPQAIRARVLN